MYGSRAEQKQQIPFQWTIVDFYSARGPSPGIVRLWFSQYQVKSSILISQSLININIWWKQCNADEAAPAAKGRGFTPAYAGWEWFVCRVLLCEPVEGFSSARRVVQ